MAKIDLVIFDFDGTLVDTAPDLIRSANFYLESKGVDALPESRIRAEIGMGLRKLIVEVCPELHGGNDRIKREIEGEFMAVYEREFLTAPTLFPGVRDFLTEWDGKIAIVSNKRIRFIHPILQKLEIQNLPWSSVIGGDSYPYMKPHPEPFMAAILGAGTTPESTMIVGDGAPDVEGALAIGSRCIAVEFGYTSADELIALGAWKSIASYEDLMPLVQDAT
jgi:phosphoglycolate phosphatase-like HAD superfamily hydrolase